MKTIFTVIILSVGLFISCSEREISKEKLLERNGIFYAVNEEKPYTGKAIEYYLSGQKKLEITYKNGKQDGVETFWTKNGHKRSEHTYKDGKRDGDWIEWYANGQKVSKSTYKDGKQNGVSTEWHYNGRKAAEGILKDDKKNGVVTIWDENGQKEREITYLAIYYKKLYLN